ncbi:hypothetical protein cypCar_00046638 [Cyprinus carpio]|nr:hypothetical protein cypCar_00046638 [Cyprinus carpio]
MYLIKHGAVDIFRALRGVFGADEVKSVMEGESVTLNITVTEKKDINMIMWKSNKSLIAKISREFSKITLYDDDTEEGFRGRLQLDPQTGSLTITNTRTTDSGDYEVTIISSETTTYTFRVTVFVHEDETQAAAKLYKHTALMKESDVTEVIYTCFITEQSSNSL